VEATFHVTPKAHHKAKLARRKDRQDRQRA